MRRTSLAMALVLLGSACGDDPTPAALATFEHFQDALFARDAAAARRLVTDESAAVVDAMPWDRVAKAERLVAVEATDERGCYHVAVRDPNRGGAPGTYVVVRENGRLVVDLVATAALCAEPGATAATPQLQPRELDFADQDAIRRYQLANPDAVPPR